jgi:hypothetical protein
VEPRDLERTTAPLRELRHIAAADLADDSTLRDLSVLF